jgi:hypothetical protein
VFVVFACSFWLGSLCWLAVDVTQTLEPAADPFAGSTHIQAERGEPRGS